MFYSIVMKKAVIFDMDGVLVDSEPLHYESERSILAAYGFDFTREIHRHYIGYANEVKFWTDICARFKASLDISKLMAKKMEYFYTHLSSIQLITPALDLLKDLRIRKVPVALASSSTGELIERILGEFSLKKYFDAVQSGDTVKNGKPAPDIFLKAAAALAVRPQDCVVIEDSLNGVRGGKAAGMTVVAVPNEYTLSFDFSPADYRLESLAGFNALGLV
jgi:beta-phosphoglucomutase family hydrolase